MLLAYADESYEEWGYGGSLVYRPGTNGRGLQMRLGFNSGAMGNGVQHLWSVQNANGLMHHGAMPFAPRSDVEIGFGMGDGLLWHPYVAADGTGHRRFGLRLGSGQSVRVGLEIGRMNDGIQSRTESLVLRGDVRF